MSTQCTCLRCSEYQRTGCLGYSDKWIMNWRILPGESMYLTLVSQNLIKVIMKIGPFTSGKARGNEQTYRSAVSGKGNNNSDQFVMVQHKCLYEWNSIYIHVNRKSQTRHKHTHNMQFFVRHSSQNLYQTMKQLYQSVWSV